MSRRLPRDEVPGGFGMVAPWNARAHLAVASALVAESEESNSVSTDQPSLGSAGPGRHYVRVSTSLCDGVQCCAPARAMAF